MQTRNQWRGPRDWKVVAGIATVATLGITGLAMANPGEDPGDPAVINLEDRAAVTEVTMPTIPQTDFSTGFAANDSPYESPFDDAADDSPESADSPDESVADSPEVTSTTAAGTMDDSEDSMDDSPEVTSTTVADSMDDSIEGADDSADGSFDS